MYSTMLQLFHFILDHRVGGPHVYVQTLTAALGPQVQSTLVTTGNGPATDLALVNLRHLHRALYPFEVVCNALRLFWRFRRREARRNCVFDVHGAANVAPLMVARLIGIPVVWHFHETLGSLRSLARLGQIVLRGGRYKCIVVARAAVDTFRLKDAILIPGAVDFDFWSSAKYARPPRNCARRLRILSVGNLNPLKGVDVLLRALETFGEPWELVIVGAELQTYAGYAQELRDHAGRLESPSRRIRFAGWQSREEVRSLMADSDVFVLPSKSEACPLALLEAMATGRVCVATDVGDVREILEAKGCGIVVPRESPSALAAAFEYVAEMGTAERKRLGKMAKETIVERYSLQKQAAKHLGIYKDLVLASERTI